ncbi:MAG: hypothetical protein HY842_18720, partial [Bacteroidetes bacterium]|nr:hypothetical protein [Bacteroidota bacterium]
MEKLINPVLSTYTAISLVGEPAFRKPVAHHFRIHKERPFLASERSTTTVLTGGLSPAHDFLLEGAMKNLGLKVKCLPSATLESFQIGREYSNNGLCNPSYFMVGNLINYLRELEKSGLTKEEIVEQYV